MKPRTPHPRTPRPKKPRNPEHIRYPIAREIERQEDLKIMVVEPFLYPEIVE